MQLQYLQSAYYTTSKVHITVSLKSILQYLQSAYYTVPQIAYYTTSKVHITVPPKCILQIYNTENTNQLQDLQSAKLL